MTDSRHATERYSKKMERVVDSQTKVIYFLCCILISLFLTYILKDNSFTQAQQYALFTLFLAVGLWITEAIPPFAVGILIVGFLVFSFGNTEINSPDSPNYIDVTGFVNTWSNSVIWLILGGFFLARGMRKTGLDVDVFRLSVSKFGNKPNNLLFGIMLATAVGSMIISNTAMTAMMVASVTPLMAQLDDDSPFIKALLLGIPAAAAVGGMGTIIGSPPNAIAVDAINNMQNINIEIGFLEWMMFGVPISLFLVVVVWFFLTKKYSPRVERLELNVFDIPKDESEENELFENEERIRKRIVLGVLVVTVLLWLTSKFHGIPAAAVSGIPIVVLTMVGIITGSDVRKLPWDTLMLVAGGLSLGTAIQQTGLALHFADELQHLSLPLITVLIVFSVFTVVLSNIMSNTATASILIPVAAVWAGINPIVLPLVIGLSASCALFLPVSTPPNAIVYSTEKVKQNEFRLAGSIVGVLGPILIILWVLLIT